MNTIATGLKEIILEIKSKRKFEYIDESIDKDNKTVNMAILYAIGN